MRSSSLPRTLAGLFTLVFLAVLVRTAWISDDALITLRTVMNVTHGFGLTFNIAERVQSFTHPLWMALLTGVYLVLGNVYFATFALSIGVSLVAFWVALRRAITPWQAVVAALVLLFSRAFVDYSTSGLENPLSALLLAASLALFLSERVAPTRRLTGLATLTSLLYLTRPDNVLFILPLLVIAAYRVRRAKAVLACLATGALPALAWTAFALVYYGFPFPNTAYAKLATGINRGELWEQGGLFLIDSLDRDPVTLLVIGFAIVLGFARRPVAGRALAAGLLMYLLYIVSIGGDFMAGRFFAVPLFGAVLLITQAAAAPRFVWIAAATVFAIAGTASSHIPLWSDSRFDDRAIKPNGVVDERAVYFRNQSLVTATRATFLEPEWPTSGHMPPARLQVIKTCGTLGGAGLGWGPYVHLLDECALTDPLLARLPAVFNPQWRTGHYRRMIPDGYEDSLATGTDLLHDARLRTFYEDLRTITRSPALFTRERWGAILRVNLGRDNRLIDVPFYRHSGSIVPLDRMSAVTSEGEPADGPGSHVLTLPLAVTCEDRPGRRYLDISLDSAESYRLMFLKRTSLVSVLDLGPIPEYRRKSGLTSYTEDIPPHAEAAGFDTIVIAPRSNNAHYAVGHLLLDGFAPTDAELKRRVAARDGTAR